MLKIKVTLFLFFIFQSLFPQNYTVSGYIEDVNTGERIIGAYVIDSITQNVAQTNNYGFYTLKNLNRNIALRSTYIGLKSQVIYLSLKHDTLINIQMKPMMELQEVIIELSVYKHNITHFFTSVW
jgi:hypothetical protein